MGKYENFGDFIAKKRQGGKITMRKMAELLGCSAPFLSDVEKGRRNPFDMERMQKFASILSLSEEDKNEMYDLAGKERDSIAPDLPDYIKERDYVTCALRTARDMEAGRQEWMQFVEELKRRKR